MNDTSRVSITAALREAADLLDQHPEIRQPYLTTSVSGRAHLAWFLPIEIRTDDEQRDAARDLLSALRGHWKKAPGSGDAFNFVQSRGLLDLTVQVDRPAVCERVVVGTETVTVPAVEAVEARPERTETREIVEWRCQPLLAGAEAVA